MAAHISEEISQLQKLISTETIPALQTYLNTVDRLFFEQPEHLEKANHYIESKSDRRRGKATPDASHKQAGEELILSCQQRLDTMQRHLKYLLKNLEDKEIIECYENFLLEYESLKINFELLLEIIPSNEVKLKFWDIGTLEAAMRRIIASKQANTSILSSDAPVFDMDEDFTDGSESPRSSASSSSTGSSNPDLSVNLEQRLKRNKLFWEKAQSYSAPFFSEDNLLPRKTSSGTITPPQSPLNTSFEEPILSEGKKPHDAIAFLAEMLKKAEYLYDNIFYLCCSYRQLHHNQKDDLYKGVASKLTQFSNLTRELKRNLNLRMDGFIRSDADCSTYEGNLKSIVQEMRAVIQDPTLITEMHSLYKIILDNMINLRPRIRAQCEIAYTFYQQRKEELNQLCNEMGAAKGIVRLDIKEMREKIKEEIVDDVFGPLEIEPSTYSFSSSQFFSPEKETAEEKASEKMPAPSRDETHSSAVEQNKFEPLTFEKERFSQEWGLKK